MILHIKLSFVSSPLNIITSMNRYFDGNTVPVRRPCFSIRTVLAFSFSNIPRFPRRVEYEVEVDAIGFEGIALALFTSSVSRCIVVAILSRFRTIEWYARRLLFSDPKVNRFEFYDENNFTRIRDGNLAM